MIKGRKCPKNPAFNERMKIVEQYVKGRRPARLVAQDHGICRATFSKWVKEYKDFCKNEENVVPLQPKSETPPQAMDYATPQDEITALKAELAKEQKTRIYAENKVKALNRMIDIAESQGIQIRKNSGAKQ